MSAIGRSPQTVDGWPQPRLLRLLGAVIGGEVLGAVTLWVLSVVLAIAGLTPFGGAQHWVWLPWQIDGVWALVGAIGWGYLVCTLVALLVSDRITRRGYERPAAAWLRISIAISGYGAMAVGHTGAAHVFVAVVSGPLVIRLVAFEPDGSARAWRWTLTRREQVVTMLLAALVGLSYSALHPFAADGSGGSYGPAPIVARVAHLEQVAIGLNAIHIPAQITGVTLTGSGAAHFRVHAIVLNNGGPVGAYPVQATRFPYRVPAGQEVWITARVRLSSCGDIGVNTLRLRYTILGINTTESIPLSQPLIMTCES
jgi:hypothetical protein